MAHHMLPIVRGCPACAGIGPRTGLDTLYLARLPRMRGDRPKVVTPKHLFHAAAPHARG